MGGVGPPGTLQCRGAVRFGAGFLMCWFCWCDGVDGCLCYESTVQCSNGPLYIANWPWGCYREVGSGHSAVPGCGAVRGRIFDVFGFDGVMGVCVTKALYSARRGSLYIANWPRGCYGGMGSGGDG